MYDVDDYERKNNHMKVFISQKMRDKTPEEIKAEREKIQAGFIKCIEGKECEFIKSYLPELKFKDPITSLSQSLALLAEADVVLIPFESTLVDMNKDPKGCEFEYAISKAYGKKIITYGGTFFAKS